MGTSFSNNRITIKYQIEKVVNVILVSTCYQTSHDENSFQIGHTAWFDPQNKKLEPHLITKQTAPHENTIH